MQPTKNLRYSDWLGAAASGLCAIHCALTPLFFASKPIMEYTTPGQHHGDASWASLDYLFLLLSLWAVWYSAKHTSNRRIKWNLWAAWGVFTLGLLLEGSPVTQGVYLMYLGSGALVILHLYNYSYCNRMKTTAHANC